MTARPGRWRLIERQETDSTMTLARAAWRDDPAARTPLVAVAATQHAGVGRADRAWVSPPGGLWMTLAWPAPGAIASLVALPLAAGLAVAEAVDRVARVRALLKWPNDLLVADRKLAGVLCQAETGGPAPVVFVGVGLNANFPADLLGEGLRTPPISLLEARGGIETSIPLLRDAITEHLLETLDELADAGFAALVDRIVARLAWRGLPVACRLPPDDREVRGVVDDLDLHGRLLLRQPGGTLLPLHQGELFRRTEPAVS